MDTATGQALALGGAAGLLAALLARVVVVPPAFVGVAVPLVCAGGVVAGFVAGSVAEGSTAIRVGSAAAGVGGVALAGGLWAGMATLVALPDGTAVWWFAYLFATAGPVSVDTAPAVGEALVAVFAASLVAVYGVGGAVGARIAVARRRGQ
jgi:hypothetical protein